MNARGEIDVFAELDTQNNGEAARVMPRQLTRALAAMPCVDPFFAAFLAGLKLEPDNSIPIMATNCVDTIYYNAHAIESDRRWSSETLIGILVHECMHILRLDAELMKGREHELANLACDGIINRDLRDHGYRFPGLRFGDPVHAYTHSIPCDGVASADRTDTTISIYNALKTAKKAKTNQTQTKLSGLGSGDIKLDEYTKAKSKAGGTSKLEKQIQQRAQAAADVAQQIAQETGTKPVDRSKLLNGTKTAGDEADEESTSWGLDSSAAARTLEALGIRIKNPRVKLLRVAGAQVRGMMRSNSKRQRSMLVPSVLSAAYGRLMPGRRRAREYRIAIAIDASGSITREQLNTFTAAAHQWAQMFVGRGNEIQVCYWDTSICDSGPMSKYIDQTKIPNAGGGTAFECVVKWLADMPKQPTHLICFTDLCFAHPREFQDGTEVIWIVPPQYMRIETNFGRKVELDA